MVSNKSDPSSRILETVHKTAKGLYKIGFIDQKKMRKYDLLCLQPIPKYSSTKIKALRKKYHISQSVLAAVINTSVSAVQQWEIGQKHPSGPSLKLLNILDTKGIDIFFDSEWPKQTGAAKKYA